MSRDLNVILLIGDITNTFILYNHIRHLTLACCCALLLTGAFFASIGLRSIDHSHQFSRLCLTKSDQIDLGLLPPIPCQVKRAQTRQCATKRVARDSHPHSSLRHNLGPCFESLRTAAWNLVAILKLIRQSLTLSVPRKAINLFSGVAWTVQLKFKSHKWEHTVI